MMGRAPNENSKCLDYWKLYNREFTVVLIFGSSYRNVLEGGNKYTNTDTLTSSNAISG
jgi:hypothetical protein